jgi:hypothetical protein
MSIPIIIGSGIDFIVALPFRGIRDHPKPMLQRFRDHLRVSQKSICSMDDEMMKPSHHSIVNEARSCHGVVGGV